MDAIDGEFDFCVALHLLKQGKMVSRHGWNGAGMFLKLQVPDENSKMRAPYVYISPVNGELIPWVASQNDLLAVDYYLVV